MKTVFMSMFALAALTATAAAQPADDEEETVAVVKRDHYLGAGMEVGGEQMGGMVDGGVRLLGSPLFLHGRFTHGRLANASSYDQVRIGLEARKCGSGGFCGFAGLDMGLQASLDFDWCAKSDSGSGCESMDSPGGSLLAPRVGFEMGDRTKWRTSVELPVMREGMEKSTHLTVTTGVDYSW